MPASNYFPLRRAKSVENLLIRPSQVRSLPNSIKQNSKKSSRKSSRKNKRKANSLGGGGKSQKKRKTQKRR